MAGFSRNPKLDRWPTSWVAAELASDCSWRRDLNAQQRSEILAGLEATKACISVPQRSWERPTLPTVGPLLDSLVDVIEGGRGVALLRGIPVEGLSTAELEMMFLGLACCIAYPEPQDDAGRVLHHVRAERSFRAPEELRRALRHDRTLRGFQTNGPLDFHNDGSDVLIFLCCAPAQVGGMTRVVSATSAFDAVLARDPEAASVLQQPFIFDARGQLGTTRPWQQVPIYIRHAGLMNVLYKRGYIDLAQTLPEVPPLSVEQKHALDMLDDQLNDPQYVYAFKMEAGDLLIANNYEILHSRTHFHDAGEEESKRHMMRVWGTLKRNRRSLPPQFRQTREFAATWARRRSLGDDIDPTAP